MKHSANALFYPAVGVSAMAHLLLLLFLPYRPAQPSRSPVRELIPIRLFQAPPVARAPAIPQIPQIEQASPVEQSRAPALQEPPSAAMETSVGSGPEAPPTAAPEAASDVASETAQAAAAPIAAPSAAQEAAAIRPVEVAEPSAEIAGYQAILSTLRGRIVSSSHFRSSRLAWPDA
jgi:hypothetical protein